MHIYKYMLIAQLSLHDCSAGEYHGGKAERYHIYICKYIYECVHTVIGLYLKVLCTPK